MTTTQSDNLTLLLDKVITLHPEEHNALTLLAIMYAPVARSPLAQCLQKAGIKCASGKLMNPSELLPLMDKLVGFNLAFEAGGSYRCNPLLSHFLTRQAQKAGLFENYAKAVQEVVAPRDSWGTDYYRTYAHCLQDLRIALYRGRHVDVSRLLTVCSTSYPGDFAQNHPFSLFCPEPLDVEWIKEMPETVQTAIITFHLDHSLVQLQPADSAFGLLEQLIDSRQERSVDTLRLYLTQLLLRGDIRKAAFIIKNSETVPLDELRGWLAVLEGDDEHAITLFEKGLAVIKKETGKRKVFFRDLSGLFYLLALVRSGLPQQLQSAVELGEWAIKQRNFPQQFAIWMLYQYAEVKLGKNRAKHELEQACNREQKLGPLSQLFHSLVGHWMPKIAATPHLKALEQIQSGATAAGYGWLAAEAATLTARIDPKRKDQATEAEKLFQSEGIVSISGRGESADNWERSLRALMSLGGSAPASGKEVAPKATRIIWMLSGNESYVDIQPIEQKQTARGWSAGRNAALKRLKEEGVKLDFLSPQDREIVACIKISRGYGYYGKEFYEFDTVPAIRAMAGHPLVFNALQHDEQISVAMGEFALQVKREKGKLSIKLSPAINSENNAFFRWEGSGRLLLFEPTADQRRIAGIIGDKLLVPASGEAQVMAAIAAVSPHVTIHSDVAGENAAAEIVEPDSRLQVMLRPGAGGLSMEIVLL
ncbi:MAG: hypothetical protein H7Y05_14240, partial [Steroidobacteraceae bacterium]|nr:hypothetical protein [Deltaproteobacteria bacterium]